MRLSCCPPQKLLRDSVHVLYHVCLEVVIWCPESLVPSTLSVCSSLAHELITCYIRELSILQLFFPWAILVSMGQKVGPQRTWKNPRENIHIIHPFNNYWAPTMYRLYSGQRDIVMDKRKTLSQNLHSDHNCTSGFHACSELCLEHANQKICVSFLFPDLLHISVDYLLCGLLTNHPKLISPSLNCTSLFLPP